MNDIDSQLIWEAYSEGEYVKMYHGGGKWNAWEAVIQKPKKGRFESGIGINLTNHYNTARRYARGSNIVSIVLLDKNLTLAEDVEIPLDDAIEFIKTYIGPSKRGEFIDIVKRLGERLNRDSIPTTSMINLSVNLEIGGKQGLYLNDFIVERGVDASLTSHSNNEDWLIIHNPRIIKKIIHTKPSDISAEEYELPKVKDQLK